MNIFVKKITMVYPSCNDPKWGIAIRHYLTGKRNRLENLYKDSLEHYSWECEVLPFVLFGNKSYEYTMTMFMEYISQKDLFTSWYGAWVHILQRKYGYVNPRISTVWVDAYQKKIDGHWHIIYR